MTEGQIYQDGGVRGESGTMRMEEGAESHIMVQHCKLMENWIL